MLKKQKISLFFQFIKDSKNIQNKIHLLDIVLSFMGNDIYQKANLEKIILLEKNTDFKMRMLSILKTHGAS